MEPEVPPPWKPKREEAEENVEEPQETRVYIGAAFSRWTSLKRDKCFRSDAELACFLLDSYERGATALTAMKVKLSDAQQLLPVKEEVSWSPSLDQQHTDLTSQEGEQLNGLDEANVTRFPVSSVKSEHDDKKSASSHLHQRPTEGNSDSERLTSCSAKQIIAETDGELCGEAESARNPNPQPNADGKASDDELQKPETEDTDDGWKESRTFSSTNTYSSYSDCGEHFRYRKSLQRHVTRHLGKRTNNKCSKVRQNAVSQMASHTEEKPFGCDVCGQRFKREANLRTHIRVHTDVQQILLEEFPSSPRLNQQDKDSHQIKAEQEELFTCQEGEHLNGLEEADITRFPVAAIQVKSEDDEEKPDSSQLHQRPTEDNSDSEPPTNCSDKQMKAETDGDDCGGPDPDRNQSSHLQPNTDGKISDSYETEVSIDDDGDDDDWQEPLTDSETEDSDNSWKDSGAFDSGVNSDGGSNFAKKYLNCSECGKQFECKQAFKRHVASSLQRRASCCFVNKKCFKVNQAADLQGGCHTEEKPFGCDICAQRFNQNAHLKTHMRIHTGEKPFCCSICEKIFRHQYNLNRHMRVHTGEKPFSCGVCGQKFNRNTNLKTHMRIHTGEKPFGCGLCSKTFSQPGDLKRHKSVHTGEKPFKCSICSKRFTQRIHYKTHMSVHTGERPFGCDLCSKTFNREGNLKIHKRVHTGEKPFGCDICGQRFNQSTNLKTHLRVHSGEKPFCCSVCGERFTREGSLRRHMRRQGINHSIDSKVE
ncbi:zinc finger protein 260-like isoform X2 [Archocentrus centrarchus]|uniref:zinc finger protein 260-like isoform X2 n=1 Tax=Archocentrus centrarchus TaxID=63155 RepID=UPI0011EA07EB|nr:zinc finger protein 260-like isoform X2 [Archocentrus centrarchus]